jgi:hypothetical protein
MPATFFEFYGFILRETVLYAVKKLKCTLVQALRLCTGHTAHRESRGIALLFHDHGTRRGEGSASLPGLPLPLERPGTHCTGGWVGPRAGLDRCGKSCPHQNSIPGPSSTYPVAIPTELSRPIVYAVEYILRASVLAV